MASSPKIDELRKKFEENPRRYFAPLANEYRKAGDWEQAIAICREYLPQQPGHMSGHIVFGQALFEAKQLDESKTVFETALSLDPENLIALRHLGDITMAAGDKEAAKGWYKRVLDADPRNEETQALLALIEGPKAAAPTPVVAQPVTPTSQTVAMPAMKAPGSSAPTVAMTAMRPLPKLGATGLPIPAVPRPGAQAAAPASTPTTAKPTPVQSLSSQPTMPIQIPTAPASAPTVVMTPPVVPPKAPPAIAPTEEIKLEGFSTGADSASKVVAGSSSVAATVIMDAAPGMKPVSAADTPAIVPTMGLETTAVAASDAPIDSFSLDGLETTSMAPPPPAPPAAAAPAAADINLDFAPPAAPTPVAAPAPVAAAPEIELDMPSAPVPTPAAPPATEPLPSIDLEFAPPPVPAAASPAAVPAPTVAAPVAGEGLVDLDIGLAPPTAPPTPAPVAAAPPPPAPPVPAAPAPVAPVELEIEAPAPAPDSGPFVTETMAELYLKQGHREEALRVYRALLEQRPGDAGIQAKIDELSGVHAAPAMEPVEEVPVLPPADGPTIRAVLTLIAMRRPGYRPDAVEGNGAAHHVEPASHAADASSSHAADSLSVLWNGAAPSPEEEAAALMLLAAFADLNGHAHGNGALDLSGAAAAATASQAATAAALAGGAPAAPSSFSFDKFFSPRVTAEHAAQSSKSSPAGAPAESPADAAHFAQWLEGLKKH